MRRLTSELKLKTNKVKEGAPATREPEIPIILIGHSQQDEMKCGHLKATYT